jgi:hypothetical protein
MVQVYSLNYLNARSIEPSENDDETEEIGTVKTVPHFMIKSLYISCKNRGS